MIKRPLVWILGAYLLGLFIAWQHIMVEIFVTALLLSIPLLYLLLYRFRCRLFTRRDRFLWVLPVFLLLGYLATSSRMELPKLNQAFGLKVPCELTGEVTMIVKKPKGRVLYLKDVTVFLTEGKKYRCENIIAYTSDDQNYLIGNRLFLQGFLQKFTHASNPGQFDEQQYYWIEDIDFKAKADRITIIDRRYSAYHAVLNKIKSKLISVYTSSLEEKEAGTLIAMLLGEKYLLDEKLVELYKINGISHILAISGLHVSLIGMGVFWLLRKCRLPKIAATLLTIFFVYSYGILTNFSVSTNRAVVMMIVLLLAGLFGKTYDILSALSLSALIILLQNPLQIFSVGFLLSFSAILGIAVLYPNFKLLIPINHKILDSILISISATLTTTPIILSFYYQFPTYGILTNLLILPFITILTITSLLAGICGALWLPLGTLLIGAPNVILKLYEKICQLDAGLPGSLITVGKPKAYLIVLSVALLSLFVLSMKKQPKRYKIMYPFAALLVLFLPSNQAELEITLLDLGQGEGIVMETGEGTTYLIDGGSADVSQCGTYRMLPFFKAKGIDCIDYAIITHSDKDHISGLTELIEGEKLSIKRLMLPEVSEKDENYLKLESLAKEKGIEIQYISEGDMISGGGAISERDESFIDKLSIRNKYSKEYRQRQKQQLQIYCLHPSKEFNITSANSYSTVLSIRYGKFDLLLTGDLEKEGEELLSKHIREGYYQKTYQIHPTIDYDVLKVAHHGSKYSTGEEFLGMVRPEIAIISCGVDNSYGHPHKEVVERLGEENCEILITNETGAICIMTDGCKIQMKGFVRDE